MLKRVDDVSFIGTITILILICMCCTSYFIRTCTSYFTLMFWYIFLLIDNSFPLRIQIFRWKIGGNEVLA